MIVERTELGMLARACMQVTAFNAVLKQQLGPAIVCTDLSLFLQKSFHKTSVHLKP